MPVYRKASQEEVMQYIPVSLLSSYRAAATYHLPEMLGSGVTHIYNQ